MNTLSKHINSQNIRGSLLLAMLLVFLSLPVSAQRGTSANESECCCDESQVSLGEQGDCYGGEPTATVTGQTTVNPGRTTTISTQAYPEGGQNIWSTGQNTDTINVGIGTYQVTYVSDVGCEVEDSVTITVNPHPLVLTRVLLGGSYDALTGTMIDSLRAQEVLPRTEPYSTWGYSLTQGIGDSITENLWIQSGPLGPVSWVVVELRDSKDSTIILGAQPCVLLGDGFVVAPDGQPPYFEFLLPDAYFLAIKHYNHLGVMSANSVFFPTEGQLVDFTLFTTPTYGLDPMEFTADGRFALIPGDADDSGGVDAGDRSETWNFRNQQGFLIQDVNLDGVVDAADRSVVWNKKNLLEQIPSF